MRITRLGVAVVLAAAATAITVPAIASASNDPVRPMIIDGELAKSGPWAARLFVDGKENCSATIIAAQWILTAKHCVSSDGEYSFHIGNLDQTKGEQAKGVEIHKSDSADLALVKLDHDVKATYAPLGTSPATKEGETVQLYGWGATCTDKPEIQCQSQMLKVANVKVEGVGGDCTDYAGGPAVCATRGDGIAAGGDSGGPMFAKGQDGKDYQVGVASTSDRQSHTAYGDITQARDWIKSIAGV